MSLDVYNQPAQISKWRGFTIVELLIVIVVIGILAAITIIAFNGVSARARVATTQADLANAGNQLRIDLVTLSSYPATPSAANSGGGLKASNGTTYQYSVDNTASPKVFCLTATNGTTSSYIDQDSAPTSGACPGHVDAANATITNLALNPSLEANLTNWSYWGGSGGTASSSNPATGGYSGSKFGRLTWSTGTTSISGGPSNSITASPATTYSASFWVRPSKVQKVYMEMKFLNGASVLSTPTSASIVLTPGVWTNISNTQTAPSNTTNLTIGVYATSSGGAQWLAGDYIDYDAAIIVTGSTKYSFADGTTDQWNWNGATSNSSSYGPYIP